VREEQRLDGSVRSMMGSVITGLVAVVRAPRLRRLDETDFFSWRRYRLLSPARSEVIEELIIRRAHEEPPTRLIGIVVYGMIDACGNSESVKLLCLQGAISDADLGRAIHKYIGFFALLVPVMVAVLARLELSHRKRELIAAERQTVDT
jgi:hypothetical protein